MEDHNADTMCLVRKVQLWDFQQLLQGKFSDTGPFGEDLTETPRGKLLGRDRRIAGDFFAAVVMVRSDQDWKFKASQQAVFAVSGNSIEIGRPGEPCTYQPLYLHVASSLQISGHHNFPCKANTA